MKAGSVFLHHEDMKLNPSWDLVFPCPKKLFLDHSHTDGVAEGSFTM